MAASAVNGTVFFGNRLADIQALTDHISKRWTVETSSDLEPYCCFFPEVDATFLMVDYLRDFSRWETEGPPKSNKCIIALADFVTTNRGPILVFVAPQMSPQCHWVCYQVQQGVEAMTDKVAPTWLTTSWKQTAQYLIDQVTALNSEQMLLEDSDLPDEMETAAKHHWRNHHDPVKEDAPEFLSDQCQ